MIFAFRNSIDLDTLTFSVIFMLISFLCLRVIVFMTHEFNHINLAITQLLKLQELIKFVLFVLKHFDMLVLILILKVVCVLDEPNPDLYHLDDSKTSPLKEI